MKKLEFNPVVSSKFHVLGFSVASTNLLGPTWDWDQNILGLLRSTTEPIVTANLFQKNSFYAIDIAIFYYVEAIHVGRALDICFASFSPNQG